MDTMDVKGRMKKIDIDRYISALQSTNPIDREDAAIMLGELQCKKAVPYLIQCLKDSNHRVRKNAAKALGFIRDTVACKSLLEALTDPRWEVRGNAALALRRIDSIGNAAAVRKALKEETHGWVLSILRMW